MKLSQGQVKVHYKVNSVTGNNETKRRLIALGVLPQTEIVITRFAPLGDPIEIQLRHYSLSLRLSEADLIDVEVL